MDQLEFRTQFGKAVEKIEALPQEQRWRPIKDLLFTVKPELKYFDEQLVADIKEQRELNMFSQTGSSKSGDSRALYSMPQYLYAALHVLDPDFTRMQEDKEYSKILNRKLTKAFPEYALARSI